MKSILLALFMGTSLFTLPVLAQTHTPAAAEVQVGDLTIVGGFIRATLPRAPVGGGYVTITNNGTKDDRLLSVSAPFGERTDIHEMAHKDGIMTMRALPDGLPIPAGETISLEPSGNHLMIMGLDEPLEEWQTYDLTLRFDTAGEATVRFDVLPLNARSHPGMPQAKNSAHDAHGN